MGFIHEKTSGQKSRATVPLNKNPNPVIWNLKVEAVGDIFSRRFKMRQNSKIFYSCLNNFLNPVYGSIVSIIVPRCHRGGRMRNINAWYLNTHMVYL